MQIGKLRVKTDESARVLPQFYRRANGKPPFPVDSFYDVLTGKIPASKYTDKIVLIGATAAGVGVQSPVPGSPRHAGGDDRRTSPPASWASTSSCSRAGPPGLGRARCCWWPAT